MRDRETPISEACEAVGVSRAKEDGELVEQLRRLSGMSVQAVGPDSRAPSAQAGRAMSGANQEINDTARCGWGLTPINSALYVLRRSEGGPYGA